MSTCFINVNGVSVKTTVTDKASFVDSYVTELVLSCNYSNGSPPVVGFDVEWQNPNSSTNKIATLQLCSGSRCILIQLMNMDIIPQSLKDFLYSPLFFFEGTQICIKLADLRRDYGLEFRNVLEVGPLIDVGVLAGFVEVSQRPVSVIFSDWGASTLTKEQIENAFNGAYFSSVIGNELLG